MNQCKKCGTILRDDFRFCTHCGEPCNLGETPKYAGVCARCGNKMRPGEEFCPVCGCCAKEKNTSGAADTNSYYAAPPKQKSRLIAGLLGIIVGSFGIHRLYLGDKNTALLQLIVTLITCGAGGIWGFIEGILLLYGKMNKDANGNPLKEF